LASGIETVFEGLPKGRDSPYLASSMQKHLSLGLTLLLALFVAGCAVKDPANPRFVVAEGKGIKVTRAQLDVEVDRALTNFNLSRDKVPAAQLGSLELNILNQMVNRQIALTEARKSPLTNAAVLAKEQLEKMKKNFPDAKAFEEQLAKAKTTEAAMVKEIEQKLEVDNLMRTRVEPALKAPTDDEVQKFYTENPKLWQRNESVQAQHVLVKVDPTADAATKAAKKKAAEAALARVNKGEAFEKVAQEVSDDPGSKARGGELPPFSKGQMTPNFEKVAFSTAPGKTSAVFETPFGYHFLKVKAKEAAKTLKLEDVKNEIMSHLKRLKQGEATRLLLEDLRKEAAVKILLPAPAVAGPVTATTPPVSAPPVPATSAPAKK
jgi:parvulin-like peptidyl-prolyl isomerase